MNYSETEVNFSSIVGLTFSSIKISYDKDRIDFIAIDGSEYSMFHYQDCCESVYLTDTYENISELCNQKILQAYETSSKPTEDEMKKLELYDGDTNEFTFYTISTFAFSITLRWLGTSNGYYSTSVSFVQTKKADKPQKKIILSNSFVEIPFL